MSLAVPGSYAPETPAVRQPLSARAFDLIADRRRLWKGYLAGVIITLLAILYSGLSVSPLSLIGCLMIFGAGIIPAGMWAAGRIPGLPFFPIYALTFIPTFALPLLQTNPRSRILLYQPEAHFSAALLVTAFLLIMTVVWKATLGNPRPREQSYLSISQGQAVHFFLIVLTFSTIFVVGILEGFWTQRGFIPIPFELMGPLRTLSTVGIMCSSLFLFFMWGRGFIRRGTGLYVLGLLILNVAIYNAGLVLASSFIFILVALFGYAMGSQRIPFLPIAIVIVLLTLLHVGKDPLRDRYRAAGGGFRTGVQGVLDLPRLYGEWFATGIRYFDNRINNPHLIARSDQKASLVERSGLMHILLDVRNRAPRDIPHLHGQTYAIIPQTLVPRILNPNKIRSHESTYILNIHFGYQTRAQTIQTTIGWGLLNEANANFGTPGVLGLAVILGFLFGRLSRWACHAPLLSLRFAIAAFIMLAFLRTEAPASVLIPALAQIIILLIVGAYIVGRIRRPQDPIIG